MQFVLDCSVHPIGMVEMDKIVIEKRGWVYLFQPHLEGRASALVEADCSQVS